MKPHYLRTNLRHETERLNREARMYKDAWALGLAVLLAIIAVWLLH